MRSLKLKKVDLVIYSEELDNGLMVYVIPKKNSNSKYAVFSTKYGSVDVGFLLDGKKITTHAGIAHFLEHKMFETENGDDPFTFYSKNGADANANTSYYKTSYLFSGCDYFDDNLNFLLDYVQSPYFTEENIAKEQGIIGQEIDMCRDNPYRRLLEESLASVFVSHPMKDSVIGSKESIGALTPDELYTCYNTFYHPSNMFLVVTGDVDPEHVIDLVRENQNGKEFSVKPNFSKLEFDEVDTVNRSFTSIVMDVALPKVCVSYKINISKIKLDKYFILTYANMYFRDLFGQAGSFNERMKKLGIINENVSFEVSIVGNHLVIGLFGESLKYMELVDNIKKEIVTKVFDEIALNRIKKVFISNNIYSSENIYLINDNFVSSMIKYGEYMYTIENIEKMNFKDCRKVIDALEFDNSCVVVIKKD